MSAFAPWKHQQMKASSTLVAWAIVGIMFLSGRAQADLDGFVTEQTLKTIAEETSGGAAKRNLDQVTLYHRMRGSKQFRSAAEHILGQLQQYGYDNATILEYPADGETMFGTQKSRLVWEVDFAELWEIDSSGTRSERYASWAAMPLSVAQDSVSGKVTTELVDIGAGTNAADYAGKEIAGKLVLTVSQPETVVEKAVGELGAAGIISYAPNQKTAWWLQNDRLVRWGHLGSFSKTKSFAFMISLATARKLKARLADGETITLDAHIEARQEAGVHSVVTASIAGSDP